jgi:cytochrome P450
VEVLPAARGNEIDEVNISEKCPRLYSLISEVLRLYATSGLIREVVAPTVVGRKTLETDSMVLVSYDFTQSSTASSDKDSQVPYHELHLDNDTWGEDPLGFDPERFYINSKLQNSKAYRPFGGRSQLCPGRVIARRTIGYFVALLVTRFDVGIDGGSASRFPRADLAKPAAGIPLPREGDDVVLVLRERSKAL